VERIAEPQVCVRPVSGAKFLCVSGVRELSFGKRRRCLMARISREDLDYCSRQKECFDCHAKHDVTAAAEFQKRGHYKVPSCRPHFNAYKSKASQISAGKYRRRSAARLLGRRCVSTGCHNKLIPQELLPSWIKEKTCGMHREFRSFPVSRTGLLQFIVEHCLTDEERKGTAQSIIYKRRCEIVWFSTQHPAGYYHTRGFSTRDLILRYTQALDSSHQLSVS